MSSLSRVFVKRIENLQPHPNADLLLQGESDGMPFLVNKNDTHEGDLRVVVGFDICCPKDDWVPEFVRGKKIKPIKLRGVFSMCVCLPLPEGDFVEGEDVTERLGFTKYEPPEEKDGIITNGQNGYSCKGPSGITLGKYDLDSLRKYHCLFELGEEVKITEKIEGENISIVWWNDEFHLRSRTQWKSRECVDSKWWKAFGLYNWNWLKDFPGLVAIGEKYGNVNKFRYDCVEGDQRIRLFDLFDTQRMRFYSVTEFDQLIDNIVLNQDHGDGFTYPIGKVPVYYRGAWQGIESCKSMAEGNSLLTGKQQSISEGFVVEPIIPRWDNRGNRIKYKFHSERYLCHKGKYDLIPEE